MSIDKYCARVGTSPRVLTLSEVAALASRLSGLPCSDRRVRYLLITGGLGTDVQQRNHGRTRVFGTLDVALVRLALALQAEGISPALTRVVVTYLRNDLVRAWKSAAGLALALRGVHATLEPAVKTRPSSCAAWIPLRGIWHGLESEVRGVSESRQEVWMYRRVKIHEVPRNTL